MHECFIVNKTLLRFSYSLLKAFSLSENGDSRLFVTSGAHAPQCTECTHMCVDAHAHLKCVYAYVCMHLFHTGMESVLLISAL